MSDTNSGYFLDTDQSGHWCVIPIARKAEWEAFAAIPEDDERCWDLPDYVEQVGGSPSLVRFTGYTIL